MSEPNEDEPRVEEAEQEPDKEDGDDEGDDEGSMRTHASKLLSGIGTLANRNSPPPQATMTRTPPLSPISSGPTFR